MYRISFIDPIKTYGFTHACVIEEGIDATSVIGSNFYNPIESGTVQTWLTGEFISSVDVLSINTGLPPAFTSYKDVARATLVFY